MKKITLIIAAVLLTLSGFAQIPNWLWAKPGGGNGYDSGNSIAMDVSGNVYVTGYFASSNATFGNTILTNSGNKDIFIVKYDAGGNVIWAKKEGGTDHDYAQGIAIDAMGNIYITGAFSSPTITFGSITLTNANGIYGWGDVFVVKYDASGNVVWAKSAGTTAGDEGSGIALDANGNIFITGYFSNFSITFGSIILAGGGGSQDMFIVKYDTQGNVLWANRAGGGGSYMDDRGKSVAVDANGNCYVTGGFACSSITFGSTTLPQSSTCGGIGSDVFVVKYDSLGSVIWAKSAQGSCDDVGNSIALDGNGNCYIVGSTNSSPSITFGSFALNNSLNYNGSFIAKYDSNGTVMAANYAAGRGGIVTDAAGNSFVTGGAYSAFVSKFDTNLSMLWNKAISNMYNTGLGIVRDAIGNTYITGHYSANPFMNFGNFTLYGMGYDDMFIAKLSSTDIPNVWPGDANFNDIVDNTDLLPIGLYYGQTGAPRTVQGNVWQADSCLDWGVSQTSGFDIKHVDCNGDGIIDANDTLAINLNYSSIHAISANNNDEKLIAPDIYFVTSSNIYNPGDMVDVEVWAGSSTTQVTNLYGLAFNISYTASLVQPGTESLTYPVSWLGTPGADAITIAKIDALATTAYGAETRINHTNASGYGKIADFTFQTKTTISTTSVLHLSFSNYKANNSAGAPFVFNTINDSITIHVSSVGVSEGNNNSKITISPNPFTSQTTITFNEEQKNTTIKIMDVAGREMPNATLKMQNGRSVTIEMSGYAKGVYFVQITDGSAGSASSLTSGSATNVVNRKIVLQ